MGGGDVLTGVRLLVLGAACILAVGFAGHFAGLPMLAATLGPTAYVFIAHPASGSARLRNAAIGHATAIAAGLACLAAFGLWHHPSVAADGHTTLAQDWAAAAALGLTLLVLQVARAHHAPAAATVLLVATGIARPGKPLLGVVLGLAAVFVLGPALAKVPFRRKEPEREPA